MNWVIGIQRAIDYVEERLTDQIDYAEVARRAYSSEFHFQRVFSILCGYTLGEYIRMRRLTLAGKELATSNRKVIDVALRYGYDSPESFSRAFSRFHGVAPSQVRSDTVLRSFFRITVKIDLTGGDFVNYRIEKKEPMILTGYKTRFEGVPYGNGRMNQEHDFACSTRAKQWLLQGAVRPESQYSIITNVTDDGYDYYIAYELDQWTREVLYDPAITGVDFMDSMGFESIELSAQTYAVFRTEYDRRPIRQFQELRKRIVSEWLPSSGFVLADAPEIGVLNWWPEQGREHRYGEIWLPVQAATDD